MTTLLKSIKGRLLGLGPANQLVSNEVQISQPCVDASITVGSEISNARAITIQLKDSNGNDINYAETCEVLMYADAAQAAFVTTGGSTGIAIGTDGALLTLVAKKAFMVTSETDGDIDLTYTDTGTEAVYLGLRLPNGRVIMSSALTNA